MGVALLSTLMLVALAVTVVLYIAAELVGVP
jgi:hypothetical protein